MHKYDPGGQNGKWEYRGSVERAQNIEKDEEEQKTH
mgnify:CR=1 FL=1